jgi:hypothetical protein
MTALLLSLPAAAQQAPAPDPHHAAGAPPATPAAPAQATPTPAPATQGGMGMMSGPGGMGMMGMMGGEGRPSGMPAMRHHGAYGSPTNVIINIGPGIRLEVEDADRSPGPPRPGMMQGMMPGGMQGASPMGGMAGRSGTAGSLPMTGPLHEMLAERVEGGLAFLRAELRIRPDQEAAWTAFAGRIREAAARYRGAVERMPAPAAGLEARLALAESRLAAELERARACREAAAALLPALDEAQRRTADALAWLVIPGSGAGMIAGASSGTGR